MPPIRRLPGTLLAALSVLAACGGDGGGAPRLPFTEPDAQGPMEVGILTASLTDTGRGRTLEVAVAYPAEACGDPGGPACSSPLPDRSGAPYPVILLSHGFAASWESYEYLMRHLAAFGFVVVAPNHAGSDTDHILSALAPLVDDYNAGGLTAVLPHLDTLLDHLIIPESFFDRPRDIAFLIDSLPELPAAEVMDADRVGITGHSFGGYTTLAASGAPINVPLLDSVCPEEISLIDVLANIGNPGAIDPGRDLFQCQARKAPSAGGLEAPLDLGDPRLIAGASMAPVSSAILGPDGQSAIGLPFMMLGATEDSLALYQSEQADIYGLMTGDAGPKYLVTLIGGNHFSFSGSTAVDDVIQSGGLNIDPEVIAPLLDPLLGGNDHLTQPIERGNRLNGAVLAAFFRVHLAGDDRYADYLTSEGVSSWGEDITLEAK